MDASGQVARFAMREQDAQLRISGSIDLTAIDLVSEEGRSFPAPIVSPLVAQRAAAAEAAKVAALPPPVEIADTLEVRGSQSGGRSRVAFYWSEPVDYTLDQEDGLLTINFDLRADPDIARMRISPPEYIDGFSIENTIAV